MDQGLMDKEQQRKLFEGIKSGHKGQFLISTPGGAWPVFIKFKDAMAYSCAYEKLGWSYEGPGALKSQLDLLKVISLDDHQVTLQCESQTKTVLFDSDEKGFYWGR